MHLGDRAARVMEDAGLNPTQILIEMVGVQHDALAALRPLMCSADNSNAMVGAARANAEIARQVVELMGRGVLLPASSTAWRTTREFEAAVRALIEVADDAGVDPRLVLDRLGPAMLSALLRGTADDVQRMLKATTTEMNE